MAAPGPRKRNNLKRAANWIGMIAAAFLAIMVALLCLFILGATLLGGTAALGGLAYWLWPESQPAPVVVTSPQPEGSMLNGKIICEDGYNGGSTVMSRSSLYPGTYFVTVQVPSTNGQFYKSYSLDGIGANSNGVCVYNGGGPVKLSCLTAARLTGQIYTNPGCPDVELNGSIPAI